MSASAATIEAGVGEPKAGGPAPVAQPRVAKVRRLRTRRNLYIVAPAVLAIVGVLAAWGLAQPERTEPPTRRERQEPAAGWVQAVPLPVPELPPPPVPAPIRLEGDEGRQFIRRLLDPPQAAAAPAGARQPQPGRRRTVEIALGEAVELALRPARAEESYPTVVLFPGEEEIAEVVTSWRETDLSLLRRENTLTLKLLSADAHGEIQAVGASGAVYRIFVRPAREGEEYDGAVIVRLRAMPEGSRPGRTDDGATALAAAMVQGASPAGVTILDARRDGQARPILEEGDLRLGLLWVYESAAHRGYVIEASNTGKVPLLVQKERFAGRQLLLVGAEEHVLEPGRTTRLYLVLSRDDP